jgi:hypothetical protein
MSALEQVGLPFINYWRMFVGAISILYCLTLVPALEAFSTAHRQRLQLRAVMLLSDVAAEAHLRLLNPDLAAVRQGIESMRALGVSKSAAAPSIQWTQVDHDARCRSGLVRRSVRLSPIPIVPVCRAGASCLMPGGRQMLC